MIETGARRDRARARAAGHRDHRKRGPAQRRRDHERHGATGPPGVCFALDDFGTGFSSLSYLALLQPRIIKIDQSFVSPSMERARNDVLLEAIVSLGHKLNMTMLAEGIETEAQLERLRDMGCELGPGLPLVAGRAGRGGSRPARTLWRPVVDRVGS